jgi:membrane protein YdbS with pleckstrin-like domain
LAVAEWECRPSGFKVDQFSVAGANRCGDGLIQGMRMGRYIDEILQPGERVLYSTNEHWMFFLPAIAAWIVAVVFLVLWRMVAADALVFVWLALAAIAGLAALYWTATAWFHRWTTETDVTNMRVVHKTGFIKRRTFEMNLDKVESVDVNQSILGRLMNYGDITIQGVGEGIQTISTMPHHSRFVLPSRQGRSARKHGVV